MASAKRTERVTCPTCAGNGEHDTPAGREGCDECGGSGRVTAARAVAMAAEAARIDECLRLTVCRVCAPKEEPAGPCPVCARPDLLSRLRRLRAELVSDLVNADRRKLAAAECSQQRREFFLNASRLSAVLDKLDELLPEAKGTPDAG